MVEHPGSAGVLRLLLVGRVRDLAVHPERHALAVPVHGEGWGRETDRADCGVRVNGDDVLATGLFIEHFNKYDVKWYGERGRTIFYQNEKAYDTPNQAAVQNGDTKGYAAYRVDDSVEQHEGRGMGSCCYDNVDPTIISEASTVPSTVVNFP